MFRKIILIFLLLPLKLLSQDITGVWTGTIYNDTTQKYIPYEIAINEEKGKLGGYSHSIFIEEGVKRIIVKSVKIKAKDNKFFVEDEEWVYKNFSESAPKRVKQLDVLTLSIHDSVMVLSGPFNTNRTKEYLPTTGSVQLSRKKDFKQSEIIPKLEELNLSKNLSFTHRQKDTSNLASVSVEKKDVAVSLTTEGKSSSEIYSEKQREFVPIATTALQKQPDLHQKIKEKNIAVLLPKEEKNIQIPEQPKRKETISTPTIIEKKDAQQKIKEKDVAVSIPREEKKSPSVIQPNQTQVTSPSKQIKISEPVPQSKKETVIATPQNTIKKDQTGIVIPKQKDTVLNQLTSPIKKSAPAITSNIAAAEIATRKIETIKSVYFKSDSLTITLYDNGEVDGDIVSVLLNGKVIMPNVTLTTNAIKKTIYMTPDLGDSLQLIMYAENLGSIPPNTGLLILQDGDDRYEIRFAGDMQKNSAIILRRKSH